MENGKTQIQYIWNGELLGDFPSWALKIAWKEQGVEVLAWLIDYMMPVQSPSAGLEGFFEEFEAQYEAGGFWMPIWHPFLTGRLARWRRVELWLEQVLEQKDVWFAPLEDIVAHIKTVAANGQYRPRVDDLPYYSRPVHLG